MTEEKNGPEINYTVLVNTEGQHCLWWVGKKVPAGWNAAPVQGTKAECLAYVREAWTDMTPLSLRRSQ